MAENPVGGEPVRHSSGKSGSRVRMSAAQRREQLISIGRQLFAERGFREVDTRPEFPRRNAFVPVAADVGDHEGDLEVTSTENVNTIFKVYIPYDPPKVDVILTEDNDSAEDVGIDEDSTAIMVVEDDVSLNDFISQSLKIDGYRVLSAKNGDEAVSSGYQLAHDPNTHKQNK